MGQRSRRGGIARDQRLADIAAAGTRQRDQPFGAIKPFGSEFGPAAVRVGKPGAREEFAQRTVADTVGNKK